MLQSPDSTVYNVIKELQSLHLYHVLTSVMYDLAKFGIFDMIPKKGRLISSDVLATKSKLHNDTLFRCLRFLTMYGYLEQGDGDDGTRKFKHNRKSLQLCKDEPGYHYLMLTFNKHNLSSSQTLNETLKTGINRLKYNNKTRFDFLKENNLQGHLKSFMKSVTDENIISILQNYDFLNNNCRIIADIGGSDGHLLISILEKAKAKEKAKEKGKGRENMAKMEGILFELPHVIDSISKESERMKMFDKLNITTIKGSMFNQQDLLTIVNADTYICKHILHNWNDEQCIEILKNIHVSMNSKNDKNNCKLLIIERIINNSDTYIKRKKVINSDMVMLVYLDGKERSIRDFDRLFDKSGFVRTGNVIQAGKEFIIQVEPQPQAQAQTQSVSMLSKL